MVCADALPGINPPTTARIESKNFVMFFIEVFVLLTVNISNVHHLLKKANNCVNLEVVRRLRDNLKCMDNRSTIKPYFYRLVGYGTLNHRLFLLFE